MSNYPSLIHKQKEEVRNRLNYVTNQELLNLFLLKNKHQERIDQIDREIEEFLKKVGIRK